MPARWKNILHSNYRNGLAALLTSCVFWSFAAVAAEYAFKKGNITPEFLVALRLLMAAVIILVFCFIKEGTKIFSVFKRKRDIFFLFLYGVIGIALCQFAYYKCIAYSDAGTATVLEFAAPVFTIATIAITSRHMPSKGAMLACVFAILGVFMISTGGNPHNLILSKEAIFWGLIAAAAVTVYTLSPTQLLQEHSTEVVLGWGTLFGFLCIVPFVKPWNQIPTFDLFDFSLAIIVNVIMGTILSFNLFMKGLKAVGATKSGLYQSIEPLIATILSAVLLGSTFNVNELTGFALILLVPFIMEMKALPFKRKPKNLITEH